MVIFFTVLGIVAVSVVAGYLVTPLIFYALEAIAYLLALAVVLLRATLALKLTTKDVFNVLPQFLCKFRNYTNSELYKSRNRESRIQYTQPSHKDRPFMEGRRGISIAIQPITQSGNDADYRPAKKDALNMVKCPAIIKVSNAIHDVILFYKSFYGHSTKVEKNHMSLVGNVILGVK